MGGNAVDGAQRMTNDEYERAVRELLAIVDATVPLKLRNKPSHGDIDLICVGDSIPDAISDRFTTVNSGSMKHFPYLIDGKVVQVDVNLVPNADTAEMLTGFYSNPPFSTILGMALIRHELSYGMNGLKLVREHGKKFHLTSSFRKIMDFVELSAERFFQGFSNEKDLFDYMFSSPFVRPDFFNPTALRDRAASTSTEAHRGHLISLAEYLEKRDSKISIKPPHIVDPIDFFGRGEEYKQVLYEELVQAEIRRKFNGHVISKATGLMGRDLKPFIEGFRRDHTDTTLIDAKLEDVVEMIRKFHLGFLNSSTISPKQTNGLRISNNCAPCVDPFTNQNVQTQGITQL